MKIPAEVKIYFAALFLIFLSYSLIYYEMVQAHELAHQKAFSYFGINSTIVFYSPFQAATIPQNYNLTAEDGRFLYFIQALNEVFEYQFIALMGFIFLATFAIITAVFILVAMQKRNREES